MSFPLPGRHSGAAHHTYCNSDLCCRCQQRSWTTGVGGERLCGPCAACCRECGRAPAPHLDGLDGGICSACRGLCGRCRAPLPANGRCSCRAWRQRAGQDPVSYVLQAFPQPLLQALGHRVPRSLHELVHQELAHRTADQLLDRVERRWYTRWAHALHEKGEDGRRLWSAQAVAEQLLTRGPCADLGCEDGHLVTTGTACTRCRRPQHRFVPAVADGTATPERVRRVAAEIRHALLEHRSRRQPPRPGQPGERRAP
ncbi:hypothetical protein [Streptomyces sp. NPDC047928]|uniref:hypothetical protein n=1 Tax=unclassified Streptomyces TaxID=2593676 RepID=UPI00371432BE